MSGELFTDYSDHPRKLVTLNPKLKSTGAGRYQLLSRWWDACRKQLGLKDFSPRTGRCGIAADWGVALCLWLVGDIRQAIDRCSNIWLHCRALVMVSSSIKRRPDCEIQRSGRNGQRDWCVKPGSHRDYLRSGYLHHRLPVMGAFVITVITPLPTKPSATKINPRTEAGRQQVLTCRCVSSTCLRSMQNTRRVSWC